MLAVIVLFVLILLLVTVLVQRAQLINAKKDLKESISKLQNDATELNEELDYRNSLEYIEQKARELGMIDDDETLYEVAGDHKDEELTS
jgi:cell division protein FtsB